MVSGRIEVVLGGQFRVGEEAERAEPAVRGDDDHGRAMARLSWMSWEPWS
ncbi:hypothetical protein [Streptomyces heilongjiangensis]|uniref:Uncharacterized protein n=1 Tax=Streptomyces heilongjiangensis TaxID=945052 RepID=A0ABW1BBQ3_9ACTN|nr:hypothetical protein [Streptomyces heilongjiangensis]MDC2950531.1 hypothetical protein [Streptomyces heilongjiangensis]